MYKLSYVAPMSKIEKDRIGVKKKIDAQIQVLRNKNIDVEVIDTSILNRNIISLFLRRLPFYYMFGNWNKMNEINDSDCIYIRYVGSDYQLIKVLKNIKKKKYNIRILMEIPTYPYDKELKNTLIMIPNKLKDKINRRKLKKYIDRIVTYSNDQSIFGIKTINISNGVDINEIKPRKNKNNKGINIIAVASFAQWHGYDRFINGLGQYYKNGGKEEINLHLVGDGDVVKDYLELINKYDLQDRIILYGRRTGKDLDEIYDNCDIALDAMGRHRSGVFYNSSLKGKEYLAKGIPIISGVETELDKYSEFKYYKRVEANDTIICMDEIIDYYNNIYNDNDKSEIIKEIRRNAVKLFDINNCLDSIVSYINEI